MLVKKNGENKHDVRQQGKRVSVKKHIGSLCKLINYLKTVEFFTLKTSQCKKGNNADSKKYILSVQCFHRSLISYILKFYMNFQVTIIGPT